MTKKPVSPATGNGSGKAGETVRQPVSKNVLSRYPATICGGVVMALMWVIYAVMLRHVLIYGEQHSFFVFSSDFLKTEYYFEGFRELLTDFLLQFSYYPALGAGVIALCLAVIYGCVEWVLRRVPRMPVAVAIAAGVAVATGLMIYTSTIEHHFITFGGWVMWSVIGWVIALIIRLLAGKRVKVSQCGGKGAIVSLCLTVVIIAGGTVYSRLKVYSEIEAVAITVEDEYLRHHDEKVVEIADKFLKNGPQAHVVVMFRNLALLRQGKLAGRIMELPMYFGSKGLYLPWEGMVLKREYAVHYYELIGHANEALHWHSEALVDQGETGRTLEGLARYNIITGHDKVAQRHINKLKKTLFYNNRAKQLEKCVGTGEVPGTKYFFKDMPDSLSRFLYHQIIEETGYMNTVMPGDPMLRELYLVAALLDNDIQHFQYALNLFGMTDPAKMPRLYREAVALSVVIDINHAWQNEGHDIPGPEVAAARRFMQAYNAPNRNKVALKAAFGDTYWYYYFFISPNRPGAQPQASERVYNQAS